MIDNNLIYDNEFFKHESETANSSSVHLITSFLQEINHFPESVVDIGCGLGDFLNEFKQLGISNILGVDGDYIDLMDLKIPVDSFITHDLRKPLFLDQRYDLALCLEVAEHIEEEYADVLVESITKASSLVLFSAAVPGQGGTHHVNERWPKYWQNKFLKHNYIMLDLLRAKIWDSKDISWWYRQNTVVLCRSDKVDELILSKTSRAILSALHPDFIDYKFNSLLNKVNSVSDCLVLAYSELEKQRIISENAEKALIEKNEEFNSVIRSKSWRLTKPLRVANKNLKSTKLSMFNFRGRKHFIRALLFLYNKLPLSINKKRLISNILIKYVPNLSKDVMTERSTIKSNYFSRIPLYPPSDNQEPNKILVIEHRIPTPDKTSASVRLLAILEILREAKEEVTFLSDEDLAGYVWVMNDVEEEIHKYTDLLNSMSVNYIFGRENCIDHIIEHGQQYKAVILCYPEICYFYLPLLRYSAPKAKIVYDTVDIHYLRFEREAEIKNDRSIYEKALWYKEIEFANLCSVDKIIAITRDELQLCSKIAPNVPTVVIPNMHNIEVDAGSVRPHNEREGIMFIGHYLHTPNQDAVIYLINDILPIVNEMLGFKPDVYLLGSSITENIKALKNDQVKPIGFVEDPSSYFNRSRVFVAPLRYGAGMKGKIGQALSYGLPLVTTGIGAEGMLLVSNHNALVADDPRSFAEAVVQLYTNTELWNKISSNGLSHIVKNFSKESARANTLSLTN